MRGRPVWQCWWKYPPHWPAGLWVNRSASLSASAMAVNVGLACELVGNTAVPAMERLPTPWMRQSASTMLLRGSLPIHIVTSYPSPFDTPYLKDKEPLFRQQHDLDPEKGSH